MADPKKQSRDEIGNLAEDDTGQTGQAPGDTYGDGPDIGTAGGQAVRREEEEKSGQKNQEDPSSQA